jgi:hypothetical protein
MKQYYHKDLQAKEKEQPAAIVSNNIESVIRNDK